MNLHPRPEKIVAVRVRTWVNGELAQDAVSGQDLLFSFADIIADVTRLTTLEAGDVILTGTPAGSTVVSPGDVVEVEVTAGAATTGRLRSPVAEADYDLKPPGALPRADDAQRAAACGSRRAHDGRPQDDSPRDLLSAIGAVSTATLASQLKKRGYESVALDRLQVTRPELKMAGFARGDPTAGTVGDILAGERRRCRHPARRRAAGRRRCRRAGAAGTVHHRAGGQRRVRRRFVPHRSEMAARLRSLAEGERMRFRSDPGTIRGSIAPLVSPFTADGEPDLEALRTLIRWQLESGSHGISLGGSTGEPSAQTTAERAAAIKAAAAEIGDRVPFVPGTGSAKLDETLELTAVAQEAGADAVLIITPYYARPTQEGLFQWYARVAGEFPDLPVIVYNVPTRTAVDIAPETIARLRKAHGNVVGVKETTKDFEHFSRVLHVAGTDTLVWSGIELLCLPLLSLGGAGFVSATANLAPAATARMYDHWIAGEFDKARELHFGLHPVTDVIYTETNPAAAKWVLHRAGLIASAFVRQPLVPLTEAGQRTGTRTGGRIRARGPGSEGSGIATAQSPPFGRDARS